MRFRWRGLISCEREHSASVPAFHEGDGNLCAASQACRDDKSTHPCRCVVGIPQDSAGRSTPGIDPHPLLLVNRRTILDSACPNPVCQVSHLNRYGGLPWKSATT